MSIYISDTRSRRLARNCEGISVIELMIALALGVIILLGLVSMASNSSQTDAEVTRMARQLDNARYALEVLNDSIGHAGFYGYFVELNPVASGTDLPVGTDDSSIWAPCESDIGKFDDSIYFNQVMSLPVQGYQGAASSPLSCIDDDDYQPLTDVVMIRRFSSQAEAWGDIPKVSDDEKKRIWVQTVMGEGPLFEKGEDSDDFSEAEGGYVDKITGLTEMPARRLIIEIYFISPCNRFESGQTKCTADADDGDPVPTLKRMSLNISDSDPTKAFLVEPIAEGIENMQLEYGLDTTDPALFIATGDPHPFGAPNEYQPAGHANLNETSEWATVVSARVTLLARNRDASPGYADPKTYSLPEGNFTPTGAAAGFRRNLYIRTIQVINQSARRQTEFRG